MPLRQSSLVLATALFVLSATPLAQNLAQKPAPDGAQSKVTAGDSIFEITKLHKIRITVSAAEWAILNTSTPRGGPTTGGSDYQQADGRLIHVGSGFAGYFPWVRADMRVDGAAKIEFKDVGLRYKGNLSFQRSSAAAPLFANFKLKIDAHGTKGTWDGEKTFSLHAGVVDTSKMREAVAYTIFREAGVPAPRTTFAELVFTVPGVYNEVSAGMFTIIEDVNKKFLERLLPPATGLLMKPEGLRGGIQSLGDTWSLYVPRLRPDRDATPHEQRRVMEFSQLISQTDTPTFRTKIGTYLDVDQFLRFLAVHAFIVNTDSYMGGGHNFYLYLDPRDDKFRFIPWDQDLSMGGRANIGGGGTGGFDMLRPYNGDQPLIYWLLDDPAVMTRYRAIIRELSTTAFAPERLTKLIDTLEKVGFGRGPSPRAFMADRAAYVQQLVAGWGSK